MKILTLVVGQLHTNCYLVYDRQSLKSMIIDPGDDADFLINQIKDNNLIPQAILLTHGHYDHLLAAWELKLAYEIPISLNFKDLFLWSKTYPKFKPDFNLKNNQIIKFGQSQLKVITTPGHTPGSVCFYYKKVLFSGDTLFSDGSVGRTDFFYSSTADLQASVRRLHQLLTPYCGVFDGHGTDSSI